MNSSLRAALSALLLVSSASAQVSAPSLVEEDLAPADEAPAAPARQPKGEPEPMMPPRWEKEPLKGAAPAPALGAKPGAAVTGAPATAAPAPTATSTGTTTAAPATNPGATPAASPTAAPTPAAAVQEPLVRPIEPVRSSLSDLRQAWTARRKALREQDVAGAEEAERRIVVLQQELGIESLRPFAVAEIRDAQRALAARLDADAVAHAALAVKLAPGLPEAHLALARARLAREPSHPGAVLASLGRAALAAAQDPYTLRATAADVAVALLAAVLAAGAAAVLVLLLRRLPLFLHDFHDLPLVRAGTPVQAGLLALALLLLPLALGLGPLAALAVAASAAWLYLRLSERLVVTFAFLAFLAAPLAAEHGARLAAFSGTIAQEIWEVEHGPGEEAAATLLARGEKEPLPAAALAALGGHAKRRGDLEGARRWYDHALEAGGRGPEALVNLGNVHMLRGDPDAAKAAWLDAADRAGANLEALAAAQLNLSKLYVRQVSLEQAQEARRRASQASPSLVARHASEEDLRANRWLVDAPVPMSAYAALAAQDPAPAALGAAVRARLAGAMPLHLWPWAPLGLLGLLWLSALGNRRLRPSRACEKCGRPACARCDGATGLLCGQCVNVFVKKGVVEGRDRLKKDQQVRRHARFGRLVARVGAIVGGGTGYLLHDAPWRGFVVLALLFFAVFLALVPGGVLPPPQPSPAASALRLGAAIVLGAAVYLIALRDLFRRTRG